MTSYPARPDSFSVPFLVLSDPPGTSKIGSLLQSYPMNAVPMLAIALGALYWIWRDTRPTAMLIFYVSFPNVAIPSQPTRLASACIRCLPPEILVDIFAMTLNDSLFLDEEPTSFIAQLQNLGHAQLLTLAQVCQQWRALALEFPTLWSTIQIRSVLWTRPDRKELVTNLLTSTLERSGSSTLRILIANHAGEPYPPSTIRLLWEHSERWGSFVFVGAPPSLPDFSVLRGKFSQLQHLHLTALDIPGTVFDAFQVAPNLKTLAVEIGTQNIDAFCRLPLEQLEDLIILECSARTPLFVAAVHRLSKFAALTISILFMPSPHEEIKQSTVPVISNIGFLCVWGEGDTPATTQSAFQNVIDNLSLPHLAALCLFSVDHKSVAWPHTCFLSLASRSVFATHLLTLNIQAFRISEAELLQVLATLPRLMHLFIADHEPDVVPGDGTVTDTQHAASTALITTSLLTALVCRPDSASASASSSSASSSSSVPGAHRKTDLVPLLNTLVCNSVLEFDDWALLVFLLSRADAMPFVLDLRYPPDRGRVLDSTVSACIDELATEGHVEFGFTAGALHEHIYCMY
ncbi:hypothetical protein C8R43DRAFT_1150658 [Mycena crocata]|nr:hypothetical protein C8R43DRAFT_1150658 [Mycena crocata]